MDEYDPFEAEFGFKSSKFVSVTRNGDTRILDFRYRKAE
jgi:hypothetical protein